MRETKACTQTKTQKIMPFIGEVINNLAQKAGILADSPELKALLSSPELAAITVPDELASQIDRNLLSLEAAKNNHPDIKKKYFKDAWDGMDTFLKDLISNDTFDQADVDEIFKEVSTTKKLDLTISKLKKAKAEAKGPDKEAINAQLAAANEAARLAKEETASVKNTYEAQIKDIKKATALRAALSNYKTIFDDLPGNARVTALESLINTALQDKNAELHADDNGNLQLLSKDGTNVFGSNNVQLTPQSFLDQSFAPILKVNGAGPKPADSQQQRQNQTIPTEGQPGGATSAIKDFNAGVLASMNDQSKKVSLI